MRRLVVALIVTALALSLAGCGGGEEPAAPAAQPAATPAAAPPAPPAAPGTGGGGGPDYSAEPVQDTWEKFPQLRGAQPDAVKELIEARQPVLLFFFDPIQSDSSVVRAAIASVVKKYRGLIDVVSYDVSRGLESTSLKSTQTAEFSNLCGQLGIRYTPYVVLVNADGYITWRARGPVDAKILEKAVLRATE